jgi:sterol desaturase/sphingolipid hydroxylase (fatty acid hydroxylase superfamily)
MGALVFIPLVTFLLLLLGERVVARRVDSPPHRGWDWAIHLSGFFVQGAVIPWCGYLLAARVLPAWAPGGAGVLQVGWWGAFLLNFVFVDFLYYWQHRAFHRVGGLWKLHRCHHTARRVDVWVTSRNSLVLHFLFVYFLVNPALGYLVDRPDAFFAGAMATASLDLFRHSNADWGRLPGAARLSRWLGAVLVLPSAHHRHHGARDFDGNYGANLIVWDRLFGTFLPPGAASAYPAEYGVGGAPPPAEQWLYPLRTTRRTRSPHAP